MHRRSIDRRYFALSARADRRKDLRLRDDLVLFLGGEGAMGSENQGMIR